ncbi:uncharacterized protein ASCRUDRAFT_38981, partial [Ascoidea rubescens DSM 1968]
DSTKTNLIQNITFSWMNPLIIKGYSQKSLSLSDLPIPPIDFNANDSTTLLSKNWLSQLSSPEIEIEIEIKNKNKNKNKKKPKKKHLLFKAIINSFGFPIILAAFYELSECCLSFLLPQLLRILINFFSNTPNNIILPNSILITNGIIIALLMFLISILSTICFNQYFIIIFSVGLNCKSALMGLIYKKTLKLHSNHSLYFTTSDIINFMSVDVSRIQQLIQQIQLIISSPIRLILSLISLYSLLNSSIFSSLLIISLIIPINTFLFKKMKILHKCQMKFKDRRTRIISEILSSIKSIKLYSWENPVLANLKDVRNNQELKNLQKIGIYSGFINFSWSCIPFFLSCFTFALFVLNKKNPPLTPDIIFPSLTLFNMLSSPLFQLPGLITAIIEASIAINRITNFLLADELDLLFLQNLSKFNTQSITQSITQPIPHSVNINNLSFTRNNLNLPENTLLSSNNLILDQESKLYNYPDFAIKNISFVAKKGDFSCIIGKVGSGKSTFLRSILGELYPFPNNNGIPNFKINGSISYCSQVPWIINDSVKQNILFGHKYEHDYYKLTIDACELIQDFKVLPDGDETQVGEKGISLSGGQKARIALARAVYARTDIYILDDILSAVDVHVGQNITNKLFGKDGLLSDKTKILATNNVSILSQSTSITLLHQGSMVEQTTYYDTLNNKNTMLYDFLINNDENFLKLSQSNGDVSDLESTETCNDSNPSSYSSSIIDLSPYDSTTNLNKQIHISKSSASVVSFNTEFTPLLKIQNKKLKTIQTLEKKRKGKVDKKVYFTYARACSFLGIFSFLIMMIFTSGTELCANYWLKAWSQSNRELNNNSNVWQFIMIYSCFGIGSGFFTLIKCFILWVYCSTRASMYLHNSMATSILMSPMQFFETTPAGRILNHFSSDMNKIDERLPRIFNEFFSSIISTIFTLCVISYSLPIFSIIIVFLSIIYFYYQKFYITSSRELKRIVSTARSPIFSHLQESLNGVETIRSYKQQERFEFINITNIEFYSKAQYVFRSIYRWLLFRLQFIGATVIFSTTILSLLTLDSSKPLSAGLFGLIMSYALQITNSLNLIVKTTVEIETNIVCVERVLDYSNLPSEKAYHIPETAPARNWPINGKIEINNLSARYRDNLGLVLDDISLSIKSRQKIGIVGRTGAGKSTLALALFRLIEACDGNIHVDGINISSLGLYELRSRLNIIPQDSQTLEGTVRSNLDPLDKYCDEELWKALRLSHLYEHIVKMSKENGIEDGLQVKILESGINLSAGQRQLMSLARALLNQSSVLVLDEATAAVDQETDKIIQETIRKEFNNKTILTIAHRLETVMDSDKILVLEQGKVKEFDSPKNLLNDKTSEFFKLCQESGSKMLS